MEAVLQPRWHVNAALDDHLVVAEEVVNTHSPGVVVSHFSRHPIAGIVATAIVLINVVWELGLVEVRAAALA
jgi:hypothetical protein